MTECVICKQEYTKSCKWSSCKLMNEHAKLKENVMNVSKELFLEELEAVKHCIEMTNDKIGHDTTRDRIVAVLNERIAQLEAEVDATIAAQEFGADMSMDVA